MEKVEFAVYKGENLLAMGTAEECAKKLGIKTQTIRWMASPAAQDRILDRKDPKNAKTAFRI